MGADPRQAAGEAAERQMAHYLGRAFSDDDPVRILHGLRLQDPRKTEVNGSTAIAQIDHLVIHTRGVFIVESKSVSTAVRIQGDGSGGDVWERQWKGRWQGMPSPIQQARRQGAVLRDLLHEHRAQLLGKIRGVAGLASRLVNKTDQAGFKRMPIQLIVAVSDHGRIQRVRGWKEPSEPFGVYVTKADLVAQKIRAELDRHAAPGVLLGKPDGDYGMWSMSLGEVIAVRDFLESQSTPLPAASAHRPEAATAATKPRQPKRPAMPKPSARPACKQCGGHRLAARSGRYGYYWACGACQANTPMARACPQCNAPSERGEVVRVAKSGPVYTLTCQHCEHSAVIWDAARDRA